MKRVVITGATGAIGTALIREMIENEIEVLVLCRTNSERNKRIPNHPLVKVKYCSLEQLNEVKNDTGKRYDVFYHFAWLGTTGDARNDTHLQNQNIAYALDAVHAATEFGCDVFIGAGSQAEYGRVDGILKPNTPTVPENGYGIAKLCAGFMTREKAHQEGMKHIWVRILSVYGPNDGAQSMVMSTINSLQKGIVPKCTKGEQMWDYLYNGDAAKAFRLLGEKGVDGKNYVLGSGKVRPLAEYIKEIQKIVNPSCALGLGEIPYAPKQVMHLQADISDLQQDTGFEPNTDFATGIQQILEWRKTYELSGR